MTLQVRAETPEERLQIYFLLFRLGYNFSGTTDIESWESRWGCLHYIVVFPEEPQIESYRSHSSVSTYPRFSARAHPSPRLPVITLNEFLEEISPACRVEGANQQ